MEKWNDGSQVLGGESNDGILFNGYRVSVLEIKKEKALEMVPGGDGCTIR